MAAAKNVQITSVIGSDDPNGARVVTGRITHVPNKNAIHASDLKLKTIHMFVPVNGNWAPGTVVTSQILPTLPSISAAYGSLPTRDNFATVFVMNIGTSGPAIRVAAGTFAYQFLAIGE